jgi:hypothetical protein
LKFRGDVVYLFCCLKVNINNNSRHFNISTGVRQSDALFNIALNMALEGIVGK